MYLVKVNPITNFPGQGLFVYGQKTLYAASSALDRINVARLVAYIRDGLDPLARPYAFEPNDEATRASAQDSVERFLGDIMAKRVLLFAMALKISGLCPIMLLIRYSASISDSSRTCSEETIGMSFTKRHLL